MIHLIKKKHIYNKFYIDIIHPKLYIPKFFQFEQKHYQDMIIIISNFDGLKWLLIFVSGNYIKNTIKQHIPKKVRKKRNELETKIPS